MNSTDDLAIPVKIHKVAIVTGTWQRPHIFRMFAHGVKSLQETFKDRIDLICCIAGSEGEVSKGLCDTFDFNYIETPNQPLGVKMNKALELARNQKPDYCLMIGSDDLIGVELMRRYISLMDQGIDFVSLLDCYFFDTVSRQGLYWAGYTKPHNKGKSAGIGKLISTSLLNQINWNCFPPGFDKVLDTGFEKQLEKLHYSKVEINLKKENLFALDIKSQTNMTPFARWDNTNFVDGRGLLYDNLPEHLAKLIYGS